MIEKFRPEDFKTEFKAVGCLLEYDARVLFLQRSDDAKVEPGKWGHPAGKVEVLDDCLESAVLREVREETGLDLEREGLFHWGVMYVRYPEFDFEYHVYRCNLNPLGSEPEVRLSKEHKGKVWETVDRAISSLDLMRDEATCLKMVYGL